MSASALVSRFGGTLLDLLFPPRCLGCGRGGGFLCPSCVEAFPRIEPPLCPRCGIPLEVEVLCPRCLESPPTADGIGSVFLFDGLVRETVHQLKYRNLRAMALPLGRLLAEYLDPHPLPADALVPVPLHSGRLRRRGFNQASLLAGHMGRILGLPLVENALVRLQDAPSQAGAASAAERHGNVRGAFSCRGQGLRGRRVLLVDDVCTTGATLDACALALKEAGVASVWGLTVAREI